MWFFHCPLTCLLTSTFDCLLQLISIEEIPEWARPAFKNMKHLNRVQSRLYEAALYGADNLLLCAPTGLSASGVFFVRMEQWTPTVAVQKFRVTLGAFSVF